MLPPRRTVGWRPATALGLAVLYALVGAAGQGLHGLTHAAGSCHTGECHHKPAFASASCGCSHSACHPAPRKPQKPADAAFRAPGEAGHDPHNCGICSLIAALKVGYAATAPLAADSLAAADTVPHFDASAHAAERSSLGARGPPAIA